MHRMQEKNKIKSVLGLKITNYITNAKNVKKYG